MKKTLSFIFLFLPLFVSAQSDLMSEPMSAFIEGSRLLQEGIDTQDKYLVADAADAFSPLPIEELDPGDFVVSDTSSISNPEIQYNYIFCQDVRKNGFVLVERDPLDAMRATSFNDSPINTISRSILPGGKASFTVEWADDDNVEVAVVSPSTNNLVLSVESNQGALLPVISDSNVFYTNSNLHDGDNITVTLENPSSEKISFCIAIK